MERKGEFVLKDLSYLSRRSQKQKKDLNMWKSKSLRVKGEEVVNFNQKIIKNIETHNKDN